MAGQQITGADLSNRFTYHPPTMEQANDYVRLRQAAYDFAALIVELVPPGRQASLAVTAVEEAVMRANAGIAQDTPILGNVCPSCAGKNDFHSASCSAHADVPAGAGG